MQSYELTRADTYVAMTGSQNISFQFSSDNLVQRIDRRFIPSSKQRYPTTPRSGASMRG